MNGAGITPAPFYYIHRELRVLEMLFTAVLAVILGIICGTNIKNDFMKKYHEYVDDTEEE